MGPFYLALITSLAVSSVVFCFYSCCTRHSCGPWGRWVNNFTRKHRLIQRYESLLIPRLVYMSSACCKCGTPCGWGCLTFSILNTLVTLASSHCWIMLSVIFNWPLCTLCHVWVHIIWSVPVSVEPSFMVYGGGHCTPNTTEGHWPYLLLFLWPLLTHSCAQRRSPRWCSLSKYCW